jgi:amphi-Trp domain-containing protein
MADREVEKDVGRDQFVATLRRMADAIEQDEAFRIQIAQQRFTIPAGAALSIEHEVEGDEAELELKLEWHR